MTKLLKNKLTLPLAMAMCLSLTACGDSGDIGDDIVVGSDWRASGVVRGSGAITRDGEDTDVLVCVHAEDAAFYFNTEEQMLFDSVEYPTAIEGDAWEAFQSIDFADLNGDGNSDVTMRFEDGGTELQFVWQWDAESKAFVYLSDEALTGETEVAPMLMSGELPFADMESLKSEKHEDGTYYYADVTDDGRIMTVNTALQSNVDYDAQTLEDYITDCALVLRETDAYDLLTVEENAEFSQKMSYPVYVVTYVSGEEEDACEWTVFAMNTDYCTYLYGLCAVPSAAEEIETVYQDIFADLYLSE